MIQITIKGVPQPQGDMNYGCTHYKLSRIKLEFNRDVGILLQQTQEYSRRSYTLNIN